MKTNNRIFTKSFWTSETGLIVILASAKLLIHLYSNAFANYGLFRDELYYIACSKNLDLGYVDQPPFSIYLLWVMRTLFGESLFAIRLLPAFSSAATVFVVGSITKELGGKKLAIATAMTAVMFAPINLGMNLIFSMNTIDWFIWSFAAYLMIRIIKQDEKKLWIQLGIIFGIGLLNKIGILWLGFGFFAALLLTPYRKKLLTPQPYLTAAIAFLFFIPYIIWNFTHDFAHLEFIRNAVEGKYSGITRLNFVMEQIFQLNPLAYPLALLGLYFFFFDREGKRFRLLGIIFVSVYSILFLNAHTKAEYISPAYPILFSGGAIFLQNLSVKKFMMWIKFLYPALIVTSGIIIAPVIFPVLPVETQIKYTKTMGFSSGSNEGKELAGLGQFYADMFGWEQKAKDVAAVFHSLTKEEQAKCAVLGDNYGRCGALDYYGAKYGLPKAIGRHNNYWIWGPRNFNGELVIVLGGGYEDKLPLFESVTIAGVSSSKYCMPYENNLRIFICRKMKISVQELWRKNKVFD